jgi:small subunit ribosomal protein S16
MLMIRLQRTGRKHETTFRVVLTDRRNSTKSGKYLERLGNYDPRKTSENLDAERIRYWISKGARPSDTLHNLLVEKKIIEGKKRNVLPRKSPIIKEEVKVEKKEELVEEDEGQKEESVEVREETGSLEEGSKENSPVAEVQTNQELEEPKTEEKESGEEIPAKEPPQTPKA